MSTQNNTKTQQWDAGTRFLHLGLAVTVSLQLFNSLILEMPKPSRPLTGFNAWVFESHEWLGMAALAIVLLHWAWSLWSNGGYGIRHLFPWNRAGRKGIVQELGTIKNLDLPAGGPKAKLAGLIHGLGLLAVTAMVLSGAVLFIWMPENGKLTPTTGLAKEAHEFMSTFVWIYWGGHVAMGLLHHFMGHETLRSMFGLKRTEIEKMPHTCDSFNYSDHETPENPLQLAALMERAKHATREREHGGDTHSEDTNCQRPENLSVFSQTDRIYRS